MVWTYIWRVLWARKLVIVLAVVSSVAGGALMLSTTANRYDASNRVQLDLVKPDPITGFTVNAKYADAYVQTQISQITDYQVAILVAERLGWLDSPDLQQEYAALPPGTGVDFNHWVAARISGNTYASPVQDSNLLKITFRATSPEIALMMASEVRNAYVQSTSAQVAATGQAGLPAATKAMEASRLRVAELEGKKAEFEKASGLMTLDRTNLDADLHRLNSLVRAKPAPILPSKGEGYDGAQARVTQMDAAISEASKTLGPNNPQLIEMRRQRDLAAKLAQGYSAMKEAQQSVTDDQHRFETELSAQRDKVLSQSEKRVELHLLQDEISRETMRYNKAAEHFRGMQRLSSGGGGIVTPIGVTEGSNTPAYPSPPLVLGGSAALGLAAGILLAFLSEMFDRRVRIENDLTLVAGTALASVPTIKASRLRRKPSLPRRRREEALA